MTKYSEDEWAKIIGPNGTFVNTTVAALQAHAGSRVYGLLGDQIVRVHDLKGAEACERVWIVDMFSVPIERA